ncbi:MAG: tetratricopeptide repeat protein [Pseudomonadota bacterium]
MSVFQLRQPGLLVSLGLCSALLAGCASEPRLVARPGLADLPVFDQSILQDAPAVSEQQLDKLYQQILALAPAETTRQKILYRLSQLHTARLDRQELPAAEEQDALRQLVQRYQQLLNDYPQDPNNELIRYQLARSYDLLGEQQACLDQLTILLQQYPDSAFAAEAWFRLADIYYSRADYEQALQGYLAVLQTGDESLQTQARYMAGWSYFKQQQFERADEQFLQLLDSLYSDAIVPADDSRQTMQQEVLRTLSISLSYQQQAESLTALIDRVSFKGNQRPLAMVAQLYQALADFLLEKQLAAAALASYAAFVEHYPGSVLAARMQLNIINYHLSDANASAALAAQQQYVGLFGPAAGFWQQADSTALSEVQPYLLQYLDYFARSGYAKAQSLAKPEQAKAYTAVVPLWQQMLQVLEEPRLQGAAAANSYQADDLRYLLAESHFGAEQWQAALQLYTELGYAQQLNASLFSAPDAAYKALLLSEQLAQHANATAAETVQWQRQQNDFVRYHSAHPAAQQVALQQVQQAYQAKDYQAVLALSSVVAQWPTPSTPALVAEAQFLHSQSELALAQYSAAEQSISALLQGSLSAARRQLLTEQLASSIYQQAQLPAQSPEQILNHLQRLQSALPDSAYHQAAAFEQITLLRQQGQHQDAIIALQQFMQRYPQSERLLSARAMLLDSYEQAEQWQAAADELSYLAANSTAPEQQREALYLAAQYYQRAGAQQQALDSWRSYANRYPQPHLLAQEARAQLVALYQQQQDLYRQNFWREKIASFEQQYAGDGNSRSQQLAAQALLELGRHNSMLFRGVALSHPLSKSLKAKQQHMSTAIKQYQQSMQFGVAELVSEAQFQVAELYQQMAKAILASDRPKGLDELALEEYELLLEEQAYPFEEQAIAIYQQNTRLTQQQLWDSWIAQSFERLAQLLPAKFDKPEAYSGAADAAY